MPETSRKSHAHRSRSHSRKGFFSRNTRKGILDPVLYFSAAILMFVFAKLLQVNLISPALGAIGIILLAISKLRKFKAGVILSIACILAMTMVFVWEWVDHYFIAVLSSEITSDPTLFKSGLYEGFILATLAWIYHKLLKSIHLHMSQKWFVKKSYVTIFKMVVYFQLFLLLFWAIAFVVQRAHPLTSLSTLDATIVAGSLALLTSGIMAIIYLSKGSHDEKKRHLHVHRRRHEVDSQVKIVADDEK